MLCEPRFGIVPDRVRHAGAEITAVARLAGIELDQTQRYMAAAISGIGKDGKWAAFEAGMYMPRQNAKTEVMIARILFGLYVARERSQVYSAHEVKTATKTFKRLKRCIDQSPRLGARIARVSNRSGSETIELTTGQVLECMARSTSGGRGFTASTLLLDEAHNVEADQVAAQMPALSTVKNPQVIYGLSFADERSFHVAALRERALAGGGGECWLEWSMDPEVDRVDDRRVWVRVNPAFHAGRITMEHMEREYRALGPEGFARERLGKSNWPTGEVGEWQAISRDAWEACAAPGASLGESPVLAAAGSVAAPRAEWESWPLGVPPWLRSA
jgi:phage terminase large subunit-like protein